MKKYYLLILITLLFYSCSNNNVEPEQEKNLIDESVLHNQINAKSDYEFTQIGQKVLVYDLGNVQAYIFSLYPYQYPEQGRRFAFSSSLSKLYHIAEVNTLPESAQNNIIDQLDFDYQAKNNLYDGKILCSPRHVGGAQWDIMNTAPPTKFRLTNLAPNDINKIIDGTLSLKSIFNNAEPYKGLETETEEVAIDIKVGQIIAIKIDNPNLSFMYDRYGIIHVKQETPDQVLTFEVITEKKASGIKTK